MKRLMFLICCAATFTNLSAQSAEFSLNNITSRLVPNTVDIRSIGMGKTEVAAKSGSNALFTNPSLLALQENGSIKLGSALHLGLKKDERLDDLADSNNADLKYGYKPNFKFTNISASLPLHFQLPSTALSIAFGAGYQNAIDLSFTEYNNQEIQGTSGVISEENKTRYTGGLNTITPGFAIGILDRISAGISLNIGFGKMMSKTISEYKNAIAKETYESVITATGKAFFPTFGLTGKPTENLAIGVSISPSYEWEWDDIEMEIETDEADEERDLDGGEFTMPLKFSIGLEYQVTPTFTLAVEYQTRPFSAFEFDADNMEDLYGLGSLEAYINQIDLKNGHVLHLGAELLAGKTPLRFGFFLEPYAITDMELTSAGKIRFDETPNYLMGGTFGLGIPIGDAVFIDAAAQYGRLKTINEHAITSVRQKKYESIDHLIRVDLGLKINLPSINTIKAASPAKSSPAPKNTFPENQSFPSQSTQPDYQSQQYNQSGYPSYQQIPAESPDSNSSGNQGSYESGVPSFENQNSGY